MHQLNCMYIGEGGILARIKIIKRSSDIKLILTFYPFLIKETLKILYKYSKFSSDFL